MTSRPVLVQKFGGTSVATAERRQQVVEHVRRARDGGHDVAIVVSAMGRRGDPYATDTLLDLLRGDGGAVDPRDYTLVPVGPILSRWKMLLSGEIDAGLQGAPLNYVAVDAGYTDLGNPRTQFPDFQFTSLDADADWAKRNEDTAVAFLRAWLAAHRWFYDNKGGATEIAVKETGVERRYAERAWDEYVRDEIFPRDGRASARAVQALIEVSSLIRNLPGRTNSRAEQYIDHAYLEMAGK